MARPASKNPEIENRKSPMTVYFTAEEHATILKHAEEEGIRPGVYVRVQLKKAGCLNKEKSNE